MWSTVREAVDGGVVGQLTAHDGLAGVLPLERGHAFGVKVVVEMVHVVCFRARVRSALTAGVPSESSAQSAVATPTHMAVDAT